MSQFHVVVSLDIGEFDEFINKNIPQRVFLATLFCIFEYVNAVACLLRPTYWNIILKYLMIEIRYKCIIYERMN